VLQQLARTGSDGQDVPRIVFTKGGGLWLDAMRTLDCEVLGLDWTVNLHRARQQVQDAVALQGNLDPAVLLADEAAVRGAAERVCAACGVRDYARVDFILSAAGDLYLLEINTLPGMKPTSLLPMSAGCVGLDFSALVRALVAPAVTRFQQARARAAAS